MPAFTHRLLVVLTAVIGLHIAAPTAHAQFCKEWIGGPTTGFGYGTNGRVRAAITWDHDGFPSSPSHLVIAGQFTLAGGVPAKNIAAWDGTTWRALGTGISNPANNAEVYALTVYNGEVVAGGFFSQAGGVTMDTHTARWNGVAWANLGSGNVGPSYQSPAYALAVFNGSLMIGSQGFGGAAIAVRSWHPTNGWGSAANFATPGIVRALEVSNGWLYAAGRFDMIAGAVCQSISKWNGTSWQPPATGGLAGGNAEVHVLKANTFNNTVVVGGSFAFAGGSIHNNVALLDATGWFNTNLNTGVGGVDIVHAATITPDATKRIVIAGVFGGNRNVNAWDGSAWQNLMSNLPGNVWAMHHHDPVASTTGDEMLLAAGDFAFVTSFVGTVNVNGIAQIFDSLSFAPLHHAPPVRTFASYHTGFMAGGDFVHPTLGGVLGHYLVRWDGTTLRTVEPFPNPLGSEGTNGPVHALRTQSVGLFNRNLYIGGDFTVAGDVAATRIARYSTSTQTALSSFNAMGAGFNNRVTTIELHNNEIYAGGFFTHSGGTLVNYVARWNNATSAWLPLASGLNGFVYALKSFNGELYAAGTFTFSGAGAVMPRIARWNGTSWNSVNTLGMNGGVFALAVFNNELIAGGDFSNAGGVAANAVAKWNGSIWAPVGSITQSGIVNTLTVSPGNQLIAGGRFYPGPFLENCAYYDGTGWYSLQFNNLHKGPFDRVYALGYRGSELQVAGDFGHVQYADNSYPTPTWGRLMDYTQPLFTQNPVSPAPLCPGDDFQLSVTMNSDYAPGSNYRWRRNGVDLNNGFVGATTIAGADTATLSITNMTAQDAGTYTCAVSKGGCAPGVSLGATVSLATACPCPADLTGEGAVNVADLLMVINFWGACPIPSSCPADVNDDGTVNVADLLAVISAWGICP